MALTLITGPTTEPITVDELKEHLRIDGDDDDAYILSCIKAARVWFEGQTKRGIITQTWDYSIDFDWPWKHGQRWIDLPLNPVASVTSITYVNEAASSPLPTLAAADYDVVARQHGSYIVPAYNVTWAAVRAVPNAVIVRFVVGEATAPDDVKMALMVLAGHYYENRETAMAAPRAVEALVSPYRGVMF